MKNRWLIVLISVVFVSISFFFTSTYQVYAEPQQLSYDSSNITITLDDDKWAVFKDSEKDYWNGVLDEDEMNLIYGIMDGSRKIDFVAIPENGHYLWYFGRKDSADTEAMKNFSESKRRSSSFNDLSDDDLKNSGMGADIIAGLGSDMSLLFEDVAFLGDYKYYLIGAENKSTGNYLIGYMTLVNGYYYTFIIVQMTDDFSEDDIGAVKAVISDVKYKDPSEFQEQLEDKNTDDNISDTNLDTNDAKDIRHAALVSFFTVLPVAVVYVLAKRLSGRKKENQEKNKAEIITKDVINNEGSHQEVVESDQIVGEITDPSKEDQYEKNNTVFDDGRSKNTDAEIAIAEKNKDVMVVDAIDNTLPSETLRELKKLHDEGVLTDEEFAEKNENCLVYKAGSVM